MTEGSCLCGAVKFAIDGRLTPLGSLPVIQRLP